MADPADEKPRLSDAEMLAKFKNAKKRPACSETLGMELMSVDQENMSLRMSFNIGEQFSNPTGAIQGGFLTAMLDEAMSVCCIIASNVTMTAPTLELKTSYFRPLFPGHAEAEARILRRGKSIAFMEAELFDPEGRVVAKASATAAPKPFKRL
ncbi:PaaI family thioesterase [Ponticaulis sp.]|uniref:PaaI family thioesterase n=1 Tax=Ponticaulis sp. TaxID=2020902 RepID=UPI0025D9759A|nr:PaaI family thioesterase [Ponticaulis sp.]MDF1681892.1 PaaI family thioesterase [Ponticaulis sp.]